jgi:hypothetical protein
LPRVGERGKCDAIQAIFDERGMELVGRTRFPDEKMPSVEELVAANADTVVLFAGDGTVNTAACKYDKWNGKALILPGGTMNVLAKRLHGEAEPHDIVHKAHEHPTLRSMPYVESGPHRAFCALIVGPAGGLGGRARGGRYRRFKRLIRAGAGRLGADLVARRHLVRRHPPARRLQGLADLARGRLATDQRFLHRDLDAGGAAGLGMADGQLAQCADGGRYPIGACDGDRAAHAPRSVRRGGSQIAQPRADQQRYEQPALRDDG